MEISLLVIAGRHAGQEISVRRASFLIGRDKDCQLRLGCTLVSRRHCAIRLEDDRILIEDLQSTNGTFLNGEEVNGQQELHHGDRVNVGTFEFQIHALDAAAGEQVAGSAYPETISATSPTTPTNHGVTGREIGLDLLKMDTTVGSKAVAKPSSAAKQPASRKGGSAASSFDSIVVCGEDVTQLD